MTQLAGATRCNLSDWERFTLKKSELARRLGWHLPQVDRLFDLRHASKLEQVEAAANVLGRHIEVHVY